MALFIGQSEDRSELQQRLNAELQDRAKKKTELENKPLPDGVNDSNYLRETTITSSFAWVWVVLSIISCVAIVAFVIYS